jgi:hypothetical protein
VCVCVCLQEGKRRLQEAIAEHMAAHQAQVRAANARVKREELRQLGAQFAAHLQQRPGPEAASGQVRSSGGAQAWISSCLHRRILHSELGRYMHVHVCMRAVINWLVQKHRRTKPD